VELARRRKSFHGVNKNLGYVFPRMLGPLNHFETFQNRQHQLFAALDFDRSPDWELNIGYGDIGLPLS
jgi:hypothetical protein